MTYTQVWDLATGQPSTWMIIRDADQAAIPNDPRNGDWGRYQAWLDEGNTPNPPEGPLPDPNPDDTLPVPPGQAYRELQELEDRVAALEDTVARMVKTK